MVKKIYLIDDDSVFVNAVAQLFEVEADLEVFGCAASEAEAHQFFRSGQLQNVDCVILDLKLPRTAGERQTSTSIGIEVLATLRTQENFDQQILVVTDSLEPNDGEQALAGGCDGYLYKTGNLEDLPTLADELKVAIRGDVLMIPRQMRYVFLREVLTLKEAKLMELLDRGSTWNQVAKELGYRNANVATAVGYRIFDKLLSVHEQETISAERKREKAIEYWRARCQRPRSSP
ncbi:MAG: response regulator transcription factor [Candidatus Obscuribacterales bacterium]|nr:response regulator transcription factor [Candidatus Obscuribacterales bacterium]